MQLFEVCDLVRPMAAMLWSNQQYWDWGEQGSRYNHRFEDFTHRGYYILRACKIFLNAVFLSDHCLPWFILFILKQMWTDSQPQANCPFLGGGYVGYFARGVAEVYCADDLLDYHNYLHCWVWRFFTYHCPLEATGLSHISQESESITFSDSETYSIFQDEGLGGTFRKMFWLRDHSHVVFQKQLVAIQVLWNSAAFDAFVCRVKLVATHLHVSFFFCLFSLSSPTVLRG